MNHAGKNPSLPASLLLLALAYFVTGRLGLLLAIPPGYATAVWPASGIAVAALLVRGYFLWPGVLLGSFLVNISTAFDGSVPSTIVSSLIPAASVGVGASLQALLGAFLINRCVDIKSGLVSTRSILRFLALGGPISCVVSATWGVTTFWLFGSIADAEILSNWMNWWVGDTVGVVIFLPLTYIWYGHPAEVWRRRKLPVALSLTMPMMAIIALFVVNAGAEQERIAAEYRERAVRIADSFENQLMRYFEVLHSISRGLFIHRRYR